jgi:ketosteroid isomerase-like protein
MTRGARDTLPSNDDMASAKEEAEQAIERFYAALDQCLRGKPETMAEAWHHTDYVTTVHPFGHWAQGWQEVWATWQEIAAVFGIYKGHEQRTDRIGGITGLKVGVHGDAAYGASVFESRLLLKEGPLVLRVNCTNVVHKIDGAWKLVHHHPDQAPPDWTAAIGRMVQLGHA